MFKSLSAATQLFKRPCGLFKRHFRGCLRELRARNFGAMRFFTLHSSLFVLQSYEESLTQIPVMIHLRALMVHLWYSYVQLRAIRCTYEGSRLLKWRGNPVGMTKKRCKNDGGKMQGRHLMEHKDTKTQRTMTMTMTMTFCPLFFVFRFSFL